MLLNSCIFEVNPTYIDEEIPGEIPLKFAKGFISIDSLYEFGSVFSEDGSNFYFAADYKGKADIRHSKWENGKWTNPITIISHPQYGYNDPFLSPEEDKLYYISNQPRDGSDTIPDYDIWYSELKSDKWSEPINAGPIINSDYQEYYISFASNGTMYFASDRVTAHNHSRNFDLYYSERDLNNFKTPVKLESSVNTSSYEADVFVAPDESYLIFCSTRPSGLGRGDLYISFNEGGWTEAKLLQDGINMEKHELCPFVTKDQKFLFFTSNEDLWRISTDVLKKYK